MSAYVLYSFEGANMRKKLIVVAMALTRKPFKGIHHVIGGTFPRASLQATCLALFLLHIVTAGGRITLHQY